MKKERAQARKKEQFFTTKGTKVSQRTRRRISRPAACVYPRASFVSFVVKGFLAALRPVD
jgi:hypothetical protein